MINVVIGGLIGAIVGGIITGIFTLVGVSRTHRNDIEKQKKIDEANMLGFYRAILTEIDTLWNRYQETMGIHVESLTTGNFINLYYPVTQDYFTVYKSNANLIGRISIRRLREILVKTYVEAQTIIDSYRMNNSMVADLEHWYELTLEESTNQVYKNYYDAIQKNLVDYADMIRKSHYQLKSDVETLISTLKDNISSEY